MSISEADRVWIEGMRNKTDMLAALLKERAMAQDLFNVGKEALRQRDEAQHAARAAATAASDAVKRVEYLEREHVDVGAMERSCDRRLGEMQVRCHQQAQAVVNITKERDAAVEAHSKLVAAVAPAREWLERSSRAIRLGDPEAIIIGPSEDNGRMIGMTQAQARCILAALPAVADDVPHLNRVMGQSVEGRTLKHRK